jgi:hypothetical protein
VIFASTLAPTPPLRQKFFSFINKAGEKEVKGALEIIQTSFSGLQSAINLLSSKLDKNKKQ